MSISLLEEEVGEPKPRVQPEPADRASRRRHAFSAATVLPRVYDVLTVTALAVFHHVLGAKYRWAQIAYDEHYFVNEGWSVLKGLVPYRDFQQFKPPVIFFVEALGLKLFGLDALGYRHILTILSFCGFLAFTVALLSRGTSRLLVLGVVALMIDHFYDDGLHNTVINDAESLALDFFMMGTGVLLTRTKWKRIQLTAGGVLLVLSPLSKEPLLFAVGAAWLSLLLLHRIESPRKEAAKSFAIFTAAGATAVLVTWLGYMLVTGSLGSYIAELKLSFAYAENYAYQLRWTSRSPEGGQLAEMFRRLGRGYVNAPHLAVFIPFFVALVTLSGRRKMVGVGAVVTTLAAFYAVSIGHGYCDRYFIMAMAGTFFSVVLGAFALDAYAKRAGAGMRHWVGITWTCIALAMLSPRLKTEWEKYGDYKAEPPPVPQSDIDFVRAHTGPSDKIWATDDPLLYVYSGRVSAFRGGVVLDEIIDYYPGNTDEERLSSIREGLIENRPKLVVFGDSMVSPRRKQRYMNALVMPFLRDGGYVKVNDRFYERAD
jgi:hypothetical protein